MSTFLKSISVDGSVTATSFNSITGIANVTPVMDGIGTIGTSSLVARQDHVHPSDTSRATAAQGSRADIIADQRLFGFIPGNDGISIEFNPTTFVFSIIPDAATWRYINNGTTITVTGSKQVTLTGSPPVSGTYYVYLDATGTLIASTTTWNFGPTDYTVPVAIIEWNNTLTPKYLLYSELHPADINRGLHAYLHNTNGSQYSSGASLSGYLLNDNSANASIQWDITAGSFYDETLKLSTAAIIGGVNNYIIRYRDGSNNWRWVESPVPALVGSVGSYIGIDIGTGTLVDATSGNYLSTWVMLTPSGIQIIQPQTQHATLSAAASETFDSLTLTGLNIFEFVAKYQLISQVRVNYTGTTGNCRLIDVVPINANAIPAASGTAPGLHAGTHGVSGTDPIIIASSQISDSTVAGIALLTAADATAQRTSLSLGGAAILNVGTTTGTVCAGDDSRLSNTRTTTNALTLGTGLTGTSFNGSAAVTATVSYGSTGTTACVGNDSRLSDARTPTTHNQAEATITFTDITTGNATTSLHGFLPKLGGGTVNYLRADGTWATPPDTNTVYTHPTYTYVTPTADTVTTLSSIPLISTLTQTNGHVTGGTMRKLVAGTNVAISAAADGNITISSTDTNTTYTAGTGLTLTTTAFSVNYGSTGTTACVGNDSRLSDARTPTSHTHGNITNTGYLGSTANTPLITGTAGIIQAGSFGSVANTFCQGNDSRLSDTRNTTNSLILKFDTGTTEGTNLYTFNGSASKTIDIKGGTNVSITEAAGIITISSTDTNTTYTPASTVIAETSYGAASAVGTSVLYARADHTHGTPATTKDTTAITGLLKGNGTTISAAVSGTDYVVPTGTFYIGTTSVAHNRSSAALSLTGISIDGSSGSCVGNSATATILQTARTINGVSFNGSANITIADSTKLPLTGTAANTVLYDGVSTLTYSASIRANRSIIGGGTITVDSSYNVLWTQRFLVMANGRGSHFSTTGYFDIVCPDSGTITGVGGASNKTATAAGIPLGAWEYLYYILPIGSANTSVPNNFRVCTYTTDVNIPYNWVLICARDNDNSVVTFNNGISLTAGESLNTRFQSSTNLVNSLVRRDATGSFEAGNVMSVGLYSNSIAIAKPADYWSSGIVALSGIGQLESPGSYAISITSNGYRNTGGTWTSYSANGTTGAAQVTLSPNGEIYFGTDANKVTGSSITPTVRMTLSAVGNLTVTGAVTAPSFTGNLIGNASTATILQTTRTINGVSFNGSANINIGDLRDSNGAVLIDGITTTSAINYVSLTNAAAAGTVKLATAGTDTNIPFEISTKGTGALTISTLGGVLSLRPGTSYLRLYDDSNTYYFNFVNTALTGNYNLTLPNAHVTLVGGTMVPTTGTGATGTWSITATSCSKTVIAGNGLTGGGALTSDVTLTMGTPGSLTASTTNAVTATSHTHAVSGFLPLSGGSLSGSLSVGGGSISSWTTANTDIDALVGGSVNGMLITGYQAAHVTVALPSNDFGDGFQIISKEAGNATYTLNCFEIKANGNMTWSGIATGNGSGISSVNAATLNGQSLTTATTGSSVVQRTSGGYINATYFNGSSAAETTDAIGYVFYTADGYFRKKEITKVRDEIVIENAVRIALGTDTYSTIAFNVTASHDVYLTYGNETGNPGFLYIRTWNGSTYNTTMRVDSTGKIYSAALTGSAIAVYTDGSGNLIRNPSDGRLKTNIEPIKNCLDKTLKLQPVYFDWKEPETYGSQRNIGLIAQEVQSIIPEVIAEDTDGIKGIDYPKLVSVLAGAIQEQQGIIDSLIERLEKAGL